MQYFYPRINMLNKIFFQNNPAMNYGSSKSAKIVLSKSIFYVKNRQNFFQKNSFKRLRLGKTTSWQHRFFDLTILSPIWLGTYEYMKNTLKNFFFGLKQGFQSGFFRFGQKFSNLTVFLCT